jgi:seryl-tRNA synthetase
MTLDVTNFIDNKGGNSQEIRESQRKRGHSVEVVDEVIQMYHDWVKSTLISFKRHAHIELGPLTVDFDANQLSKQSNALQKQIGLKKKACVCLYKCSAISIDL